MFAMNYVKYNLIVTKWIHMNGVRWMGEHEQKMTEKQVKKKLGIRSWDEIRKGDYVEFIEVLPKLDKDVLLRMSESIPHFLGFASDLVQTVRLVAEKSIEEDEASTKAIIEALSSIQNGLADLTKRENLSFEDMQYVCSQLMEIAGIYERMNKVNKEHSEKRMKHIVNAVAGVATVLGAVILAVFGIKDNNSGHRG